MFEYQFNVRGYELDSFGHANHAVYLNYFEQARWEMFRHAGIMEYFEEKNLSPVVIEVQVRYSHEVCMFDELIIRTEAFKEDPYLVFRQKMYFQGSNRRASTATVKVIITEEGRLVRDIPPEVMDKLTQDDIR